MKPAELRLKRKLNEVFSIEPNDLGVGWLTASYKKATTFLKTMPFIVIVPFSIMVGIVLYLLLGRFLVRLASILQYGF